MHCLTAAEAVDLFGPTGFTVSLEHEWYRIALRLKYEIAAQQTRIGGRPPNPGRLAYFAEALSRWFPTNRHRLLWVDHWEDHFPSVYATFAAARLGFGEVRPLQEAPGHYFEPHPYDERDQTKISPEHAREVGALVGLTSLIMIGAWDAWLIADNCLDQIEFWEGNLFFYSGDPLKIAEAELLFSEYDCSRQPV